MNDLVWTDESTGRTYNVAFDDAGRELSREEAR